MVVFNCEEAFDALCFIGKENRLESFLAMDTRQAYIAFEL